MNESLILDNIWAQRSEMNDPRSHSYLEVELEVSSGLSQSSMSFFCLQLPPLSTQFYNALPSGSQLLGQSQRMLQDWPSARNKEYNAFNVLYILYKSCFFHYVLAILLFFQLFKSTSGPLYIQFPTMLFVQFPLCLFHPSSFSFNVLS